MLIWWNLNILNRSIYCFLKKPGKELTESGMKNTAVDDGENVKANNLVKSGFTFELKFC